MKAMVLREYNKPLVLEEVETPKIGAREVLIKVKACGVCASNVKYVEGAYPEVLKLPHILGHEPVGEVVKVGPEVHGMSKATVSAYISLSRAGSVSTAAKGRKTTVSSQPDRDGGERSLCRVYQGAGPKCFQDTRRRLV